MDTLRKSGAGSQAAGALAIDPGGNMAYNSLLMAMQKYFRSKELN